MTRRRIVVLSSAFSLLGLGMIAALAVVAVLKTQFGRDYARDYLLGFIAPRVQGTLYIGRIAGLSFGGAAIDSVELRGPDDSLFVAVGGIRVEWDPRDLIDRRTLIRLLEVDRPIVHLRKNQSGRWTYKDVFKSGPPKPRLPGTERGFSDYIVADSVVIRDASVFLHMPWSPDDTLKGAKRDSAIVRNLTRQDKDIRRFGDGFEKTWRWEGVQLVSGYARIADPDSVGRLFQIHRLDANEFDPPFRFRNVRGGVRQTADSLWLDLTHFDLPGSTGKGTGKVVWGSDLPTRYDLRVFGDSVSLADVNWVYPDLPKTGGGSMILDIRNQRNLRIIDYAISDMDLRTTRSRLRGDMTFGVGGPVLIVKDVALQAEPVNFDLLRTLAGGPFPYDWQGNLTGTVRARGGPVNRFRIDDARITFDDANVAGAVTRATARGEIDILFPAFTVFRGLDVDVAQLDLRTIQFLNPNFPRVNGIVSGTATLDSLWLDVRFRNADVTHRDGPGEPTRATGSGRVTIGDVFTSYDLALNTQPLSFTSFAHAYQEVALPLRGSYQGPLRIQGTLDDLAITAELTGDGGTIAYDGRVDGYPVNYSAQGTLTFANLDVRSLFGNDTIPVTSLNGRVELDVAVDSASRDSTLKSLTGVVSATLDRSFVDSTRIYQAVARLGFGGGRARIDTLHLESVAGVASARGALGLTTAVDDSIDYLVQVDSLGGLRRYIVGAAVLDTVAGADSIDGRVEVKGVVHGSIDSLRAVGEIAASDLWYLGDRAKNVVGGFEIARKASGLSGTMTLRADTAVVQEIGLRSGTLFVGADNEQHAIFKLDVLSTNGPRLVVQGDGTLLGDTTRVRLDTLSLTVRDHQLQLARPTTVVMHPAAIDIDTLTLRDVNSGVVMVAGTVPVDAPIALSVRADSVELGDVGELIQANVPFGGLASMRLDITGVRNAPRMTIGGSLDQPRFGDVRLDRATFDATYANQRLATKANLFRESRSVLSVTASIPVDLALTEVPRRLLPDSLSGEVRSENVELAMFETVSPTVVNASGTFAVNLDIGGVWPRPRLTGDVTIRNGALGLTPLGDVRLSDLDARLTFLGDSVQIDRFTVATREERVGTMTLAGWISVADPDNPRFDLTLGARDFHIIDRPRIAHLDMSATGPGMRLSGSYERSSLTGLITIDRGTVYIPETIDKQVISLDSPEVYSFIDTTLTTNRTLFPKAPPALLRGLAVNNVQVRMGNDVWLRSSEANINLGGAVDVTVGHDETSDRPFDQLALDGTLTTNRGTYRLNLGLLQRSFIVENGTVQFYGDPDFNPTLNINAIHTVHRASSSNVGEQDIRIRVNIGGTLAQPRLALSSADSLLNISQTDLFSYLLTGAPSFSVTSEAATLSLIRSFGSYLGDWLRVGTRGFVDLVDIELGRQGLGAGQGNLAGLNSVFSGARLTTGKQLGDRVFVSATTGLCQVQSLLGGGSGTANNPNLYESLGVKLDYRLNENVGVSAGFEPPTSALLCNAGIGAARGFAPTPRQWGFDIFRVWRF